MIRLTYSNQTERLLEALAAKLEGRDPFEPVRLIVPNRNVETFVKLGLARAHGIAANLEVRLLRRFVAELVEATRPGVRVADAELTQGLLIALFSDENVRRDPALAEVAAYLGDGDPDAVAKRLVQLTGKLSRLFDEYALARPELLEAWRRDRPSELAGHADWAATERWQRRVWRLLFAEGGLAGDGTITLDRFFREVRPGDMVVPRELHVFGISYVARLFQRVLHLLGQAAQVHVYTLNPCVEFWEDVRGRGVDLESADPFGLDVAGDTPALRLWGRPGRENVRLLNALTECDFQSAFVDPTAPRDTLLTRLQRDILERAPERAAPDGPAPECDSLRVFACAGIRRELETIAAEIWRLVETSEAAEPLRFSDIAVIVPPAQREAYQAHLQAVFAEMHDLPCCVVDLPLASESRVVEAIGLLLELPLGVFGRQDLLRLVTHPQIIGRFPDCTPEDWLTLCDALGIVHGADHADHAGTYITRDLFNWDQGLRRLALGAFMTGRRSGDARAYLAGDEAYLPEERGPQQLASGAAFALTARALVEDARFARTATLTLPEWLRFVRSLITSYVVPGDEHDERVLLRCLGELAALEAMDLRERKVGWRVVYELVRARLDALSGSRGQYLADGVVVSSFMPMRAIPFRAIFVAGLGEGVFPSVDRPDHLDLRQARRRAGDVSAREQDRYLFLETLLCARERLVLSYVCRDPLTGDARAPSPVVGELLEILRGYLPPALIEERIVRKLPLRRHEDAHTRRYSPAAEREARARALGEDLRRHLGGTAPPALDRLRAALDPAVWAALVAQLGVCPAPERDAAGPAEETVQIPLAALRRFLECPLQGSARFLLGMREDDDEDLTARTDEPFATPGLEAITLLREIFLEAARTGEALERAYDARVQRERLSGVMPTGPFAAAERAAHLAMLAAWRETLDAVAPGAVPRIVRFGQAEEHARVDALHDPIVLPVEAGGRRLRVELYGRTEAVVLEPARAGSLVLQRARSTHDELRDRKETLRGFLDHAALAAAGLLEAPDFAAFVARPERKPYAVRFRPFSPIEARAWLGALARELLSDVHAYLLPCEAVLKWRKSGGSLADIVDGMRDGVPFQKFSSLYGPVRNPTRYGPPPDDEAQAMAERRFGPYFARAVPGDEQ